MKSFNLGDKVKILVLVLMLTWLGQSTYVLSIHENKSHAEVLRDISNKITGQY